MAQRNYYQDCRRGPVLYILDCLRQKFESMADPKTAAEFNARSDIRVIPDDLHSGGDVPKSCVAVMVIPPRHGKPAYITLDLVDVNSTYRIALRPGFDPIVREPTLTRTAQYHAPGPEHFLKFQWRRLNVARQVGVDA